MRTVTRLLEDWRGGDRSALDELLPLVYGELRTLANSYMRNERKGHTLRATDLVGEAYLKLADAQHPQWNNRVHFFAIAARAMRQVLIDHARKRSTAKRGDSHKAVTFDEALIAGERPGELIALDDALAALATFDERKARVIEMHYFGGMTQPEIAEALELHVNTVAKDLRLAEAWIHRHLHEAG